MWVFVYCLFAVSVLIFNAIVDLRVERLLCYENSSVDTKRVKGGILHNVEECLHESE